MDPKLIFTIIHLFGVAIGAGGAFLSDGIFFSSIKNHVFSRSEMRFLRLASHMVWMGLFVLILSGIGLFLTDPDKYLHSSKFLAKMTIVLIITINGVIFHLVHLPFIRKQVGVPFSKSRPFLSHRRGLLMSGGISLISWSSAIILGSLSSVRASYGEIMGIYLLILIGALTFVLLFPNLFLSATPKK